jgi:hypothetical protein
MESLYMPAVPIISSLKWQFYAQIFISILILCILFVLLWYFVAKHRRHKKLVQQLHYIQSQSSHLEKQMLIEKIKKSESKDVIVFFLEYLERFAIIGKYYSVDEILAKNGFDSNEIEKINKILYVNAALGQQLKAKIRQFLD